MRRISLTCLLSLATATALAAPLLPVTVAQATVPGRNGLIAWTHPTGLTSDSEVYVINPDGTGMKQLTDNGRNDFFPAWAPNGYAIAFESSTAIDLDIWILDAAGERNLTNDGGHADRYPAWSPDGRRIAFSRQSPLTGAGPIYTVKVDGTDPRKVTSADGVNEQPSYAPRGDWIAFVSDRSGNHDIWAVHPDGTGLRQVTDTPGFQEGNPNWSPDSTRIAYDICQSATFPCPGSPDYEIVTANADGTGRRQLTDVDGIDFNPAWSPDGTQLVFRSDRTGFTQLWTMNADGSDPTQLTSRDFTGGVDPDWQPLH